MRFRTKTIVGIAFIEIVLLLILVVNAMAFLTQSNQDQLYQRADSTLAMFSRASRDGVLSTDLATLNDLADELMLLEDVRYVQVKGQGVDLVSRGDLQTISEPDTSLAEVTDGVYDRQIEVSIDGVVIGEIFMGFDVSQLTQLLATAKQEIVAIASLEVLLVAIFSFVFGTYLTRNLDKFTHASEIISKKGPGYQLNIQQNDEVGEVAQAFDHMSRQLDASYQALSRAKLEAEQASAAKSRFLATMSHEVRTPMNGVLGFLNLLKDESLTDRQHELVDRAAESGELMLFLLSDVLDFSQIEAGKLQLELEDFSLNAQLKKLHALFNKLLEDKDVGFSCKVDHKVPAMLYGDPKRYSQILLNLVGNSIKFTQSGQISVEVSGKYIGNNQFELITEVSDTGVGISPQHCDEIFKAFAMVEEGYNRTHEGLGLGLSICQQLVKNMRGQLAVESQLGDGSTFTFKVPLPISQPIATDEVIGEDEQPKRLDCRVLLAEDNKTNQILFTQFFLNAGITIDLAENGRQAVNKVIEHDYDVVFMDISMPEMDGIEACQRIREMSASNKSELPIIALTAHALKGDREKFLAAGMDDYLPKPTNKQQLIRKLNQYLY